MNNQEKILLTIGLVVFAMVASLVGIAASSDDPTVSKMKQGTYTPPETE